MDGATWELRRMAVANDAPKNTPSRFLSVMVRLVKKNHPELRRLISYQDTAVHAGTIYRASGWVQTRIQKAGASNWVKGTKNNKASPLYEKMSEKKRWELALRESPNEKADRS